jgi:polyphosphate kinase
MTSKYNNRELSWLEFNSRVLSEAGNKNLPLFERVRFLSIASNNLDEFYMVRVAGVYTHLKEKIKHQTVDGLNPKEQLKKIKLKTSDLLKKSNLIWSSLKKELSKEFIFFKNFNELSQNEKLNLYQIFSNHVAPILTPQAIDPSHPFPFLFNQGHFLLMELQKKTKKKSLFSIIILPKNLKRFYDVSEVDSIKNYVSLEEMVSSYASELFTGYTLKNYISARVTRDSDIEVEEEAEDLVLFFEKALKKRKRGRIVRLELRKGSDKKLKKFLVSKIKADADTIDEIEEFVGTHEISQVIIEGKKEFYFKRFKPREVERVKEFHNDYFEAIKSKDMIVHHPYETFDAVIQFLNQAAGDPKVMAIKQTLYRTTLDSPIVKALKFAAENGKSVTAVVEIKARFDEEANINLAKSLERSGVQVVYGFVHLKTHAKASLVIRTENGKIKKYIHVGTGNYHPINAKIYTDLSLFSADEVYAHDIEKFFNFVTGYADPGKLENIILAPKFLRPTLNQLIDNEIKNAKEGKHAEIWAKMNSLVDPKLIDRLYEASKNGVKIYLFVRGICCLRPGVKKLSENIVVKSIVGRFLEHSRIYCFANGDLMPSRQNKVFISSADLMPRNLDRRLEIMIPIKNETVHAQVLDQIMMANFKDKKLSWILKDKKYHKVTEAIDDFSAHEYFMNNPSLSGQGKSIIKDTVINLKK